MIESDINIDCVVLCDWIKGRNDIFKFRVAVAELGFRPHLIESIEEVDDENIFSIN